MNIVLWNSRSYLNPTGNVNFKFIFTFQQALDLFRFRPQILTILLCGVVSMSVLLSKVLQCSVYLFHEWTTQWLVWDLRGDLSHCSVLKDYRVLLRSDPCMFSLGVWLKIYKQCYGVTFMNPFLVFFLLILFDSLSLLFSVLQLESWKFIYPHMPHISHGCLCAWDRDTASKRQWSFVPFSLEDSFSYKGRSRLLRILASIGSCFCHCWRHHCQIGLGLTCENGEKEMKNGGVSVICFDR